MSFGGNILTPSFNRPCRTALFGLFLSVLGLAFAAGTPKDTPITNTASATYVSGGTPKTTFSNPVTTIVQQVYSLTITPDGTEAAPGQTKSALPGAPVYFNYILTNTGNGSDTFNLANVQSTTDNFDLSNVTIYRDTGCDGSVAGDPVVTSVTLNADASVCLIVAGTLPVTATNNQNALLNITGTSAGNTAVTDTNNWARAVVNTAGNLTATKTANPTSTVAAGGTVTYTVAGSNNGGSAAYGVDVSSYTGVTNDVGIVITDVLNTNTTFNAGSLSGTSGRGTVVPIYSTNGGTTWSTTVPTTGTVNAVGIVIRDPTSPTKSAFFTQGTNYSMTLSVTVAAGAAANTTVTNTANVTYATGTTAATNKTTPTNTTSVTVNANARVAVGPAGKAADPTLSGNATYTDPATGKTWTVALSGGYTAAAPYTDTQTLIATAPSTVPVYTGDTVAFRHTVLNNGNATSSYTLSTTSSANGYSVTLYAADGVTPLSGALGPLAPGASQDVVVKVAVPVGATAGTTVTLTATSTSSGATDATKDVVPTPVKGYSVDLAKRGSSTPPGGTRDDADDNPANQSTTPGTTLSYPVEVLNDGKQADSYNLTVTNLPAGWSAVFVQADCATGVPNGPTVTQTPQLAVGAKACYVVQVTVPASAIPGDNPLTFTAASTTDPVGTGTDSVTTTVTVTTVTALTFVTNQTATTSPNGVVTYTHTLTNNGNASATVAIPEQTDKAFTYQYSLDGNTFSSSLSGVTVAAGASRTVYVRVIVPGSAADGAEETVTVTATATYPGGTTVTASVQDRTLVRSGELRLVKTVRTCSSATCSPASAVLDASGATAKPGDYLEYTVVATNIGSGNLTNVKVSDPLPSYTTFTSAAATTTATGGTVLYSANGTAWTSTAPSLTVGQSIYVGVDTAPATKDGTITTADVLTPGQSITLVFVVRVQ